MKKRYQEVSCLDVNIAAGMRSISKVFFFFCFLAVVNPLALKAQKITSLSSGDTARINTAVRRALSGYQDLLNSLADPTNDESLRGEFIDVKFDGVFKIFATKTFQVESGVSATEKEADLDIAAFLKGFSSAYRAIPDPSNPAIVPSSISFKIIEISPVRKSVDYKLSLAVLYTDSYNGEYLVGSDWKKYKATNNRVAEFVINKVDGKWQAYISSLTFWDKNKPVDHSNDLPITGGAQESAAAGSELKSEAYYEMLMTRGARALAESRFVDAFRAYKEAINSKVSGKEAEKKVAEVKNKIRTSGKMDVEGWLFKELDKTAKGYELRHKYEDAKRCYEYAYDCQPVKAEMPKLIALLSEKISRQDKAEELFEKGLYDDASKEYQKIVGGDNGNPDLWVGWAKCYAKQNIDKEAESRFDQAISLDATNADIYYWQGKYYQEKKFPNYDKAYNCYAAYVVRVEDKSDTTKLNQVYALMSFCRGMENFNARKYVQAIDSFNYALKYMPAFAEAYYYLGRSYMQTDKPTAIKNFEQAIKAKPTFGEAHYWLGMTYSTVDLNDKKNDEKAISEIRAALKYEPLNSQWNFDLGSIILARKTDKDALTEAVAYFSSCIANAPDSRKAVAMRKKGQCQQKLGDRNSALSAYADYKRFCNEKSIPIDPSLQKDINSLDGAK